MAVGLQIQVHGLFEQLDDYVLNGVTGFSLGADMSTLTVTGTAGANNFNNTKVVPLSACHSITVYHTMEPESEGDVSGDRPPGT